MPTRDVIFNIIGRDAASPAFAKAATGAETAAARISTAGEKMTAAGTKLTHGLTLPLLAIAGLSIKAATDFNASMTKIQTQAGGSARDVQYLTKAVLDMKNVQQGPNELAQSLYHLKSVGMQNAEAMHALRQASDLAAVGGANLEETTNALAGAWRTGISGAKDFHQAVATINAVIGAGNMTLDDFNAALGTGILPTAKTFGLSLKDVGSALALFTDESVPADAAATRLRMTFSLLGAPSMAAEKHLKDIGLTGLKLANDMRKPNGLITAVGDLKSHLEDPKYKLSLSEQAQLLSRAFGGGRSSSAILSLINNYDVLQQKQAQVDRSLLKFNQDVRAQRATPQAQFAMRIADIQKAAIILGNDLLPAAVSFAQEISKLVDGFNNLSPSTRHAIEEAAKWAAILGPALLLGGKLIRLFGGLWRVVTFPARVLSGWGTANRSMTATGTAAAGSAEQVSLASLKFNASQLSQQSAAARAASAIAVAEAEKANAAMRTAQSMADSARAAGGAESLLAERAASDARLFAAAKAMEAEAAVKSAATITVASQEATQALGREQAAASRARMPGMGMMGAGMGVGFGLTLAGSQTGGQTGHTMSDIGMGAMIGASTGPLAPIAVPLGITAGAIKSVVPSSAALPDDMKNAMAATAFDQHVSKLSADMRFSIQNATAYKKALSDALATGTPESLRHLKAVADGIVKQHQAASQAIGVTESLTHDTTLLGKVSDLAGHKIMSLSDAISGLSHGMLGLADATISYKLGLKELPGELNKHNKAITGDTKAALENRQALVGLLGQVQQHAAAMEQAGKNAPAVRKAIDGEIKSLENVATKAGVGKVAFQNLIAQMKLTPKDVKTQITANTTSAMSKIIDVQTLLNNLANGQYVAHVSVQGGPFGPGDTHITNPGRSGGGHFAAGGSVGDGFFTVGERGYELGYKRGSQVQIYSHEQSRAMTGMGRVPGFADGTAPPDRKRKIVIPASAIKEMIRAFDGHVQEIVLAELDD